MPVATMWLVPGRILYQWASGVVTLEEMRAISQFNADLMTKEGQPPKVHLIMDYEGVESLPTNFIKARQASAVMVGHPQMEWGVGVHVPNTIVTFVANSLAQLFHVRYKTFNTHREALEFLFWVDPSLDGTPVPPADPPRDGFVAIAEGDGLKQGGE